MLHRKLQEKVFRTGREENEMDLPPCELIVAVAKDLDWRSAGKMKRSFFGPPGPSIIGLCRHADRFLDKNIKLVNGPA